MKTTRLLLCGIACAAALLSNCTTTTGPSSPTGPSQPTQPATLTVYNNSLGVIGYVYLSTSQASLGTDELGSSTISAGSSFSITGISAGYYYLAAVHLYTHDTAWASLSITAGQSYTWTLSDADFSNGSRGGLTIINNSSYTIEYVYLSQSNSTWGSDWLGSSTWISPGFYYTISGAPTGYVNSKMVCTDATRYALHLLYVPSSGLDTITVYNTDFPSYAHGSLKVVNTSSTSIYYLFMRMSGTTTWSDDVLGVVSTIGVGEQYQQDLIAPGTYDFRVESSSGAAPRSTIRTSPQESF